MTNTLGYQDSCFEPAVTQLLRRCIVDGYYEPTGGCGQYLPGNCMFEHNENAIQALVKSDQDDIFDEVNDILMQDLGDQLDNLCTALVLDCRKEDFTLFLTPLAMRVCRIADDDVDILRAWSKQTYAVQVAKTGGRNV